MDQIIQIAINCWIIFFLVAGWTITLLPSLIFNWSLTLDTLYWIGIIGFPILSILMGLFLEFLDRKRKKTLELNQESDKMSKQYRGEK